jgi:hypothetical protein
VHQFPDAPPSTCCKNPSPANKQIDRRYQQLLDLDGTPDAAALQQAQRLHPLLAAAIGDPACLGASPHELAALLRKEQLNTYGIMAPPGPDGERRLRGGGVYPRCSLVNHECVPNAARFDDFDAPQGGCGGAAVASCSGSSGSGGYPPSTAVSIRAIHDLPAGTEIVQSYFPLNWDLEDRQQQARGVYGFECRCPRCLTESQPGWGNDSGSGGEWETDDGEGEADMEEEEEEAAAAASGSHHSQQRERDGGSPAGASGSQGDRGPLDPTYLQLFMLKYMCPRESCFGTMAAVMGTDACECNVCGQRRTEAEFLAELEM